MAHLFCSECESDPQRDRVYKKKKKSLDLKKQERKSLQEYKDRFTGRIFIFKKIKFL